MNLPDILLDSLLDTLKSALFLYVAYLLIEFLEHRAEERMIDRLRQAEKFGPVMGAAAGIISQCGFAVLAAKLYDAGAITLGTLVAAFISTSDEASLVLLSDKSSAAGGAALIIIKLIIAVVIGFICDVVLRRHSLARHDASAEESGVLAPRPHHEPEGHDHSSDNCHCDCDRSGIWTTALHRTVKTSLFIFAVLAVLGVLTALLGESGIESLLLAGTPWQSLACAAVGLIPGCAPSIVMARLFASGALSFGGALAGLISSTGVGLAVFFKTRGAKSGLLMAVELVAIGALTGMLTDLLI